MGRKLQKPCSSTMKIGCPRAGCHSPASQLGPGRTTVGAILIAGPCGFLRRGFARTEPCPPTVHQGASLHRKRNYLRTNCPSRAACSPLQTRHAISQIDGLLARCSFDDLVKRKQFEQRESGTEFGCIWSFAGRAVPPGSGTNDTGALTSIKKNRPAGANRLLHVMCT
jgi:hypothetical protein